MINEQTRKIAIANKKGGIAKTTTAIELSSALARSNHKVLLIDLDPQGHASIGLSTQIDKSLTIGNLLKNEEILAENVIRQSYIDNLDILPSNESLDMAMKIIEASDGGSGGGALFCLRKKLEPVTQKYDFIIIDCPPAVNSLTMSAFAYAEEIIMPIKLGRYEEEGAFDFVNAVNIANKDVNSYIGHKVSIIGVLVTFYNARAKISQKKLSDLHDTFENLVLKTKIPINVKLMEAADEGISVIDYDPSCKSALAYQALAKEICVKKG